MISIVILVATGQSSTAYLTAAVGGRCDLSSALAVGLLAAIFRSEALARSGRQGHRAGRHVRVEAVPARGGKGPITGLDDRAAKFRTDTIVLSVERRWIRLTFFTI